MSRRFLIGVVFLAAAALPAPAKPNFSGDWKVDLSKSEFGQMPAPNSMTIKVTHAEPKVTSATRMASDMGEFEINATYTTDGKETTNQGAGGGTTTSTAKWDGDALIISTKGRFGDNDFTMTEKWTLSEDGKTITIDRTFHSAMGDAAQKLILTKQ